MKREPVDATMLLPKALRGLDERFACIEAAAQDLVGQLDQLRDLDRNANLLLNLDPNSDFARTCARAVTCTLHLERTLDFDLDFDRELTRTLGLNLARARHFARGLARDLTPDDRTGGRSLTKELSSARERARQLAEGAVPSARGRIDVLLAVTSTGGAQSDLELGAAPARSALRVLDRALRVLPRTARGRYREELEAELIELAVAGASRLAQLAYTLRLGGRMWSLRRALRAPAPGRERAR